MAADLNGTHIFPLFMSCTVHVTPPCMYEHVSARHKCVCAHVWLFSHTHSHTLALQHTHAHTHAFSISLWFVLRSQWEMQWNFIKTEYLPLDVPRILFSLALSFAFDHAASATDFSFSPSITSTASTFEQLLPRVDMPENSLNHKSSIVCRDERIDSGISMQRNFDAVTRILLIFNISPFSDSENIHFKCGRWQWFHAISHTFWWSPFGPRRFEKNQRCWWF